MSISSKTGVIKVMCVILALFGGFAGSTSGASAAELCREGCVLWCNANKPIGSCYQACVGRATCLTRDSHAMRGAVCRNWCAVNKPGKFACLGDCAARDAKYGK